jgi:hypothetical protein
MPSGPVHDRTKAAKSSPLPLASSSFAPHERGWGAPPERAVPPFSPAENRAAWRAWAKADRAPFGFTVHPVSSPQADHRAPALQLQAKLKVASVDDPLEAEADRVADAVIRESDMSGTGASNAPPPPNTTVSTARHALQRKCTGCEEEEPLRRKTAASMRAEGSFRGGTAVSGQLASDIGALRGHGSALDPSARSFFEARFDYGLGAVRVHTDQTAHGLARSVQARAFTVGRDIVFGSGEYQPHSREGRRLLAHELAHVVQQGALGERSSEGGTLRRFASSEHVKIGDRAGPGGTVDIFGYGHVTFGELIAMTGDFFESLDEMQTLARSGQFGREQIDLVRWKVNPTGPQPAVGAGVAEAVEARYQSLAGRNESHFSTGSSPGNSNRERYIALHTRAVEGAYFAGLLPLTPQAAWPESVEASADHFLTDAFSAGHIRTPRGEVQSYWNGLYPRFAESFIDLITCYMAAFIKDVDHPTVWHIPVPLSVLRGKIRPTVAAMAGPALANFGIGDLISIAMHDADNAGLDVVSARGPTGSTGGRWRAVGDSFLYPTTANPAATQTQQMVEEAVRISFAEVRAARSAGQGTGPGTRRALVDPANFRALPLIPSEDTTSTTNPVRAWRAANIRALPAAMQAIVVNQLGPGTQIRTKLDGLSVAECQSGAHANLALQCFKRVLLSNPFDLLARACEGTVCPPNDANPCPGGPAPSACP